MTNKLRIVLLIALLGLLLLPGPLLAASDPVFDEVKALVEAFYVDPVDVKQLNVHSSQELLAKLGDEYSLYMTAAEFEEFIGVLEGEYAGIGVYLPNQTLERGIEIIGVIEGSPAQKAGLKAGDVIVKINRKNIAGMDLDTVCGMLLGPAGSRVQLEVETGAVSRDIELTRQIINIPVVDSTMLEFNIAWIDIASFSEDSHQELLQAILSSRQAGADKWIIDLRGNPGGYINAAIEMAGYFIGSGAVTVLEERDYITRYHPNQPEILVNDPIILLIDENSASASEILAAALKDHRQAVLLGETTYGKGTVQELYPLSNGDWLKLTTARFYSPLGIAINGVGVDPDFWLEDSHMIKAAELLLSDPSDGSAGSYELLANGQRFVVDLARARNTEYWQAWGDITDELQYLPAYKGAGEDKYSLLTPAQVRERASLYYPGVGELGSINNFSDSREIVLYVSRASDSSWSSDRFQLRHALSGEEMEVAAVIAGNFIKIRPQGELIPGEYWLVFDDGQQQEYLVRIGIGQ